MSPSRAPNRQQLEEYWRKRVQRARAVYVNARAQHTGATNELGQGLIAPADGSFAVASARRAEALALHELERTMWIYADLVANGKLPPPDEDEKLLV